MLTDAGDVAFFVVLFCGVIILLFRTGGVVVFWGDGGVLCEGYLGWLSPLGRHAMI